MQQEANKDVKLSSIEQNEHLIEQNEHPTYLIARPNVYFNCAFGTSLFNIYGCLSLCF